MSSHPPRQPVSPYLDRGGLAAVLGVLSTGWLIASVVGCSIGGVGVGGIIGAVAMVQGFSRLRHVDLGEDVQGRTAELVVLGLALVVANFLHIAGPIWVFVSVGLGLFVALRFSALMRAVTLRQDRSELARRWRQAGSSSLAALGLVATAGAILLAGTWAGEPLIWPVEGSSLRVGRPVELRPLGTVLVVVSVLAWLVQAVVLVRAYRPTRVWLAAPRVASTS